MDLLKPVLTAEGRKAHLAPLGREDAETVRIGSGALRSPVSLS
jgi:hypothetical protein